MAPLIKFVLKYPADQNYSLLEKVLCITTDGDLFCAWLLLGGQNIKARSQTRHAENGFPLKQNGLPLALRSKPKTRNTATRARSNSSRQLLNQTFHHIRFKSKLNVAQVAFKIWLNKASHKQFSSNEKGGSSILYFYIIYDTQGILNIVYGRIHVIVCSVLISRMSFDFSKPFHKNGFPVFSTLCIAMMRSG